MRIIKFRGKSLNTKMWVYGDLNHKGKRTFIEYEVAPETVSQYIGLKDRNGTEIYEGDIITINGKYPKLIKYIDEYACFCMANIADLDENIDTGYWHQVNPGWWNCYTREIKVVSNIYDNPQLINL